MKNGKKHEVMDFPATNSVTWRRRLGLGAALVTELKSVLLAVKTARAKQLNTSPYSAIKTPLVHAGAILISPVTSYYSC